MALAWRNASCSRAWSIRLWKTRIRSRTRSWASSAVRRRSSRASAAARSGQRLGLVALDHVADAADVAASPALSRAARLRMAPASRSVLPSASSSVCLRTRYASSGLSRTTRLAWRTASPTAAVGLLLGDPLARLDVVDGSRRASSGSPSCRPSRRRRRGRDLPAPCRPRARIDLALGGVQAQLLEHLLARLLARLHLLDQVQAALGRGECGVELPGLLEQPLGRVELVVLQRDLGLGQQVLDGELVVCV